MCDRLLFNIKIKYSMQPTLNKKKNGQLINSETI